jgi:hypothetical protein
MTEQAGSIRNRGAEYYPLCAIKLREVKPGTTVEISTMGANRNRRTFNAEVLAIRKTEQLNNPSVVVRPTAEGSKVHHLGGGTIAHFIDQEQVTSDNGDSNKQREYTNRSYRKLPPQLW